MRAPTGILLHFFCIALVVQGCATMARVVKQEYIRVRSALSTSKIAIILDESFIDTYKDRATIDVMFTVDKAGKRPHPAFLDGDLHVAGRAPGIGLPVVAEIKNAAFERGAVGVIRSVAGTGSPVRLAGAWRLWPEHAGSAEEVQGAEVSVIEETNPDHVFEIHPVTRIDGENILASLRPPKGYSPPKAEIAFRSFENIKCRIIPEDGTITVVTSKGQINDVEFLMEVGEDGQHVVEDGRFVNAAVLDLKGKQIVRKVRMVFVKDSPPEDMVRSLRPGHHLHVFGLPRIDLSTVAWRARHSRDNPELLKLNLPYEIVVVGVYEDQMTSASRPTAMREPWAQAGNNESSEEAAGPHRRELLEK